MEIQAVIYFIDYLLRLPEDLTQKLDNTLTPIIQEEGNDMVQFSSGEWGPTMEAVFVKLRENAEQVGLELGVKNVVLEMLKKGFTTDLIMELTHLEEDKIEELRETLQ